jgi:chorismate mutase
MPDNAETLASLRDEIDRADREMHALLMRRSQVIEQLIAAKGTQAQDDGERRAAFRPDREAAVMMRLAERHQGVLPFLTVAHIWRVIIATFTQAQSPYRVHLGSVAPDVRDLARFQFGFSTPLVAHDSAADALAAVEADACDLALVPLGEAGAWWRKAANAHVMAVLPEIVTPDDLSFPSAMVFCARTVPVDMLDRVVLELSFDSAEAIVEFSRQRDIRLLTAPVLQDGQMVALGITDRTKAEKVVGDHGCMTVSQIGGAGPLVCPVVSPDSGAAGA